MSILNEDLKGRFVVLRESAMSDKYRGIEHRIVQCAGGFGCTPGLGGSAIFVAGFDGETFRVGRGEIERFANDQEIADTKDRITFD